jgi:hypothetical protein
MEVIWGKREAKYFCAKDWTDSISLIRFRKLVVTRKAANEARKTGQGRCPDYHDELIGRVSPPGDRHREAIHL